MTTTGQLKSQKRGADYYATGISHIYRYQRDGKSWNLTVWTRKDVVGIATADTFKFSDDFDTKADCAAVAAAFEALGDDYRQSEHGHRSRFTEAIRNAFTD